MYYYCGIKISVKISFIYYTQLMLRVPYRTINEDTVRIEIVAAVTFRCYRIVMYIKFPHPHKEEKNSQFDILLIV